MRRIQDEESEGEEEHDPEQEREHIAMDLFSEDVSIIESILSSCISIILMIMVNQKKVSIKQF